MHKLGTLFLAAFSGVGLAQQVADLPSVDDLLAKAVQASGGKAAMEKVTSMVSKGTIEVVTYNITGNIEVTNKAPDKQITRSTFEGFGEVLQCYDGKAGWALMPDSGMRDLAGPELDQMKRSAQMHRILHLKEEFPNLKVSKGKAGDKDAYVLGDEKTKLYFDAGTYLLARMEAEAGQGKVTVALEDYKSVEGLQLPFTMRQETGEMSLVIKLATIQLNAPVEDSKFAKPAK